MTKLEVFLGGEGSNELGSRPRDPMYPSTPGVVETLLRGVQRDGWEVNGTCKWSNMLGVHGTEQLGKTAAQSKLEKRGIARKDTLAMVDAATGITLAGVPGDATSLRKWLGIAAEVLLRLVRAEVQRGAGGQP